MRGARFILRLALTIVSPVLAAGCHAATPDTSTPAMALAAAPVATARDGPPGCFAFDSVYFTVDLIDTLAITRGIVDTRRVTSRILELGGPPRDTNPLAWSMDRSRARPVDIPTIGPLPPTAVRAPIGDGWYPISGETILLRWAYALTFHLTVRGDSLVGTWGIYSDQLITPESPRRPIPTRPASAVRVACPRPDGASSVAPIPPPLRVTPMHFPTSLEN